MNKKGFTLVELLATIVILGIVVGITMYSVNGGFKSAKEKTENVDTDINEECGTGIHISHLNWALEFGKVWDDLAILELKTEIKDIVMPINTNGKVRTSKVKVIREIPLEECGVFGKILVKRRTK